MRYKSGYKYQISEFERYDVSEFNFPDGGNPWVKIEDGWLKIVAGYAWDGLTGVPDTRKAMRAGLIHDALYKGFQRKPISLSCGMNLKCFIKFLKYFLLISKKLV